LEEQIQFYLEQFVFPRYSELVIDELTLSLGNLTTLKMFRYLYYFSREYKKVGFLKKYNDGNNNSYVLEAWEAYLKDWKHANSLEKEKIYSFECFELLKMLHHSYGSLSSEKEWIFVDEGQDYATPFINILTEVYPIAIINIFGDSKQRLANDYESYYFDKCDHDAKFSSYEINTNYRNCVEVTSHINEKCGMNMIPIGLHGSLTTYNQLNDHKIPWDKYRGRNIIIVQNEPSFVKLVSKLPTNLMNRLRYNDFTFSDKHINIMSVLAVKGLEFEEIMIYNDTMNQNEYYVACSRALNHLSILN
jgi:DNA helicase IV